MSEEDIEKQLFQHQRPRALSISEGVEAMRSAELPEEEISQWVEGKVRKQFRFPPEK